MSCLHIFYKNDNEYEYEMDSFSYSYSLSMLTLSNNTLNAFASILSDQIEGSLHRYDKSDFLSFMEIMSTREPWYTNVTLLLKYNESFF